MDIKEAINGIENIGILTKKNANIDAIGASLALFFALRSMGKHVFLPILLRAKRHVFPPIICLMKL